MTHHFMKYSQKGSKVNKSPTHGGSQAQHMVGLKPNLAVVRLAGCATTAACRVALIKNLQV